MSRYCISGNFRVIKGSHEKFHRVKFSHYGTSVKILHVEKPWRSMKETSAFVAATFIVKSGRPLDAVRMASSTS